MTEPNPYHPPYQIIELDFPVDVTDADRINTWAALGYRVLSIDWVHGTVLLEHRSAREDGIDGRAP